MILRCGKVKGITVFGDNGNIYIANPAKLKEKSHVFKPIITLNFLVSQDLPMGSRSYTY